MTTTRETNQSALTEPYWNPSGRTVSKEERKNFADRLYARMVEFGWTQADLAREAFGHDSSGRVIDREKISLWLRGQGIPGEQKMRKLACALNMTLADLAPKVDKSPIERSSLHTMDGQHRHTKLRQPVQLSEFASVQLQPGGKVILQLELTNELAHAVMAFAQKKVEQAAANA